MGKEQRKKHAKSPINTKDYRAGALKLNIRCNIGPIKSTEVKPKIDTNVLLIAARKKLDVIAAKQCEKDLENLSMRI